MRWSPPQNCLPTMESVAVSTPRAGSAAKAARTPSIVSREPARSPRNCCFQVSPLPASSACSSRQGLRLVCILRMRS